MKSAKSINHETSLIVLGKLLNQNSASIDKLSIDLSGSTYPTPHRLKYDQCLLLLSISLSIYP